MFGIKEWKGMKWEWEWNGNENGMEWNSHSIPLFGKPINNARMECNKILVEIWKFNIMLYI